MATKRKTALKRGKPIPKGMTRKDQIWEMISQPDGASVEEIVKATGLQPHTIRAVISVEKRKRGDEVTFSLDRRYRPMASTNN